MQKTQGHLFFQRNATFSPCRTWRYTLHRTWNPDLPTVLYVLLNPSTATETEDDPTIRRCQTFAKDWGYGACTIVNIFAYRTPDPSVMKAFEDPVGPENDAYIMSEARKSDCVVACWGVHGEYDERAMAVRTMFLRAGIDLWCFGRTKEGYPKHPLYLASDTELQPFQVRRPISEVIDVPRGGFEVIYIDPPWNYRDKLNHHGGGAGHHYPEMKKSDLRQMTFDPIAAKDCVMFIWATAPLMPRALRLMRAWGFKYKTIAFVWEKVYPRKRTPLMELARDMKKRLVWSGCECDDLLVRMEAMEADPENHKPVFGQGRWTRSTYEYVLLGTRGKPSRIDEGVPQKVTAIRGRHSAKPAVVRTMIESLMGDVPRVEIFARETADGWAATGLDLDGTDIRLTTMYEPEDEERET